MARSREKVPCPDCGSEYHPSGLATHRYSKRCEQNKEIAPVHAEIQQIEETVCVGKSRVSKVFVKALERRNLREFVGSVCVPTKIYTDPDGYWERKQEYWVDDWAALFYRKYLYNKQLKVYDDIQRMSRLSLEDQEKHMNLLVLKYTDLNG